MLFEIKNRWTMKVVFSKEAESFSAAVRLAIEARANLTDANLTRANLTDVDLTDANLTDVDLTGVDLTGVDLTGVDLTGAIVRLSKTVALAAIASYLRL